MGIGMDTGTDMGVIDTADGCRYGRSKVRYGRWCDLTDGNCP